MAISWFEIPAADFHRARRFYETILETPLKEEAFGGGRIAVFPYERPATGGCIDDDPTRSPAAAGTLVYLSVNGRLDRTLELVEGAGGRIAQPKTALPPGMGATAHIIDSEGNRVGLHAIS